MQCNHSHIMNIRFINHTFYEAFAKEMNKINLLAKVFI